MKKLAFSIASIFTYLTTTTYTLAVTQAPINLVPPKGLGIDPNTPLNDIFKNVVTIVFTAAAVLVMVYLVIGAFGWITSTGDKEKVAAARGKIINALIGLAILALAFLILNVVGSILHIDFINLKLPSLGKAAP